MYNFNKIREKIMKTKFIITLIFIAWTTSFFAENITREQADAIVQNYVQSEVAQLGTLYANVNDPSEEGIIITTSNEETFRAKYACWTYCLDESDPIQRRYFFVKEEGGNLLEVIASNDISELGALWVAMETTSLTVNKESNIKLFYPNPVDDWLILSCNENTRVEIYDLKGTRLFSGTLSGESICRLNVSFLNSGIYLVSVYGKTYKMIKN